MADILVRTKCDDDAYSDWTAPVSFMPTENLYIGSGDGTAAAPQIVLDFGDSETNGIKSIDDLRIDDLRFETDAWYEKLLNSSTP